MKNIFMIIIDIIRMPVFFIYCIITWLSKIDSCKSFRCFMYQVFIQLALMMSYVIFADSVIMEVGITMIITIIVTCIIGYVVIGKPSSADEWNYILGSTKRIDKNVSENYVRVIDREVIKKGGNIEDDYNGMSFSETIGNLKQDKSDIQIDSDIIKSTITLDDLTDGSEAAEEDSYVSDDDIEQMLVNSMNDIVFDENNDSENISEVGSNKVIGISDGLSDINGFEDIELPDMCINQEFGNIELTNKDADVVKSGSDDFRLDNIDDNGESVLTSMIDDDEEI